MYVTVDITMGKHYSINLEWKFNVGVRGGGGGGVVVGRGVFQHEYMYLARNMVKNPMTIYKSYFHYTAKQFIA